MSIFETCRNLQRMDNQIFILLYVAFCTLYINKQSRYYNANNSSKSCFNIRRLCLSLVKSFNSKVICLLSNLFNYLFCLLPQVGSGLHIYLE